MKVFFLTIVVLISLTISTMAQDKGIHFERNLSWIEVKDKAVRERKFIFVDFYTTWCGPCKYMSEEVFPMENIGTYFNKNFVSISVQMDKTSEDSVGIRKWYSTADSLGREFNITAYPTYLFLDPRGTLLYRSSGSVQDPTEFLNLAKNAIDPEKQYYNNYLCFIEHKDDSTFLLNALKSSLQNKDRGTASKIASFYFSSIRDPYKETNINIFVPFINNSKDPAFHFILENYRVIDSIVNKKVAIPTIERVIYDEEIKPLMNQNLSKSNWLEVKKSLKSCYPGEILEPLMDQSELEYYKSTNQVENYNRTLLFFWATYGTKMGNFAINSLSWDTFLSSDEITVLTEALKWSKKTVDTENGSNRVNYIDTYANLLYKLKNKDEAIKWEREALDLAKWSKSLDKIKEISTNLQKMKADEKTW